VFFFCGGGCPSHAKNHKTVTRHKNATIAKTEMLASVGTPEDTVSGKKHLVIETAEPQRYEIGHFFLCHSPSSTCPSVALPREALIEDENRIVGRWPSPLATVS
jgi:hypothetical protein